jgi:hypothetical protein
MTVSNGLGLRKKMLDENYSAIERFKKMRALNCAPRAVGMNPKAEKGPLAGRDKR